MTFRSLGDRFSWLRGRRSRFVLTLRRMGFLGRCDAKLQRQHVEGLAALWLRQHPGLDSMLEAVRIHREAVQDTCPPAQMYSELNWEQDLCLAAEQ